MENDSNKISIGIVGSREYKNRTKVASVMLEMIRRFGEGIEIVSGGCPDGADKIAKDLCLHDGRFKDKVVYREFPPKHRDWNEFCVLPAEHYFQEYDVGNYFERNGQIAEYVNKVVIGFIPPNTKSNGTNDTLKKARKLGKKTITFD